MKSNKLYYPIGLHQDLCIFITFMILLIYFQMKIFFFIPSGEITNLFKISSVALKLYKEKHLII